MSNSKCEICELESAHNYNNRELCQYHYWFAKGSPQDAYWNHVWKEYRKIHPIRVSRWRKKDPDFDRFLGVSDE